MHPDSDGTEIIQILIIIGIKEIGPKPTLSLTIYKSMFTFLFLLIHC